MKTTLKYSFLIALMVFTPLITFSQGSELLAFNNTDNPKDQSESGVWQLTDTKTQIVNETRIARWTGYVENLVANAVWIDSYNMEHEVNLGYKWEAPPSILQPGKDYSLKSTFTNNEFSTTAHLFMGVKMNFLNVGNMNTGFGLETIEVMKLNKDYKNKASEVKTGFFTAPKFFKGDNTTIEMIVDCFIGKDHYITSYTYNFTE